MWPSENPWPVIVVLLAGAVGLAGAWMQRRRRGLLIGAVLCLLLVPLAWAYERAIVTDRELVADNIRDMARSFQQRDFDRVLDHISKSARDLRLMAGSAFNIVKLGNDLRITDMQVELIAHGDRAKSRFRANGSAESLSPQVPFATQHFATLWEARWQREDGDWKMIDVQQYDPITRAQVDDLDLVKSMARQYLP
jgi:hypothetical protein